MEELCWVITSQPITSQAIRLHNLFHEYVRFHLKISHLVFTQYFIKRLFDMHIHLTFSYPCSVTVLILQVYNLV